MRGKLLVIFLAFALMSSACGAQTSGETTVPTLAGNQPTVETSLATEIPVATQTLPAQASATSLPATPIPTNPPDCTNSASFVADVTIADYEIVAPTTDFTKTWRVKNTGTCIWGPDYTLTYYSGERMLSPFFVPLSVTFPGQTVDISMELRAPTTDGKHSGYFVIKNPAGLVMKIDKDSRLWVIINVSNEVAAATQRAEVIPVTGNESGFANPDCNYTTDEVKVAEAIAALNSYRAEHGLTAFTVNEMLTKAAVAHANDMACNSLFEHLGSDDSTPTTRVAATGYIASFTAENVYGSYPPLSGQDMVDWWKNDKTDVRHNQNLLSDAYTEIGMGYSFYNNFGYYVLVFASPK